MLSNDDEHRPASVSKHLLDGSFHFNILGHRYRLLAVPPTNTVQPLLESSPREQMKGLPCMNYTGSDGYEPRGLDLQPRRAKLSAAI